VRDNVQSAGIGDLRAGFEGDPLIADLVEWNVAKRHSPSSDVIVFNYVLVAHEEVDFVGLGVGDVEVEIFVPSGSHRVVLDARFLRILFRNADDAVGVGFADGVHLGNVPGLNNAEVKRGAGLWNGNEGIGKESAASWWAKVKKKMK